MEAQTMSIHAQCAKLQNIPFGLMQEGPLIPLGKVCFEDNVWESIPSRLLMQALDLHSCGIFGNLEEYEVTNNHCNLSKFEKFSNGERVYTGCIYSRWNPENYRPFMVMSYRDGHLITAVSVVRD